MEKIEKIIQDNRLIAEFLGLKEIITENEFLSMEHKFNNPTIVEYLKYNHDWNWLMPVIEKCLIGEAEHSSKIANETIKCIYECLCSQNISETYNSVVTFIKWYNEQKN
jgi:methyl coenzyme M reductase subunit D